jgi:Pentapeptide repeats (8 copies)
MNIENLDSNKDYSYRKDLQGKSFKGEDLSRANFTGADIRGTNFQNAILKGANFDGSISGLQPYKSTLIVLGSLVTIILFLTVLDLVGLRVGDNLNSKINPGQAWSSVVTTLIMITFIYNLWISVESAFKWSIISGFFFSILVLCHTLIRWLIGYHLNLDQGYMAKSIIKLVTITGNSVIVGIGFGFISIVIASTVSIVKMVRSYGAGNTILFIAYMLVIPLSLIISHSNSSTWSYIISASIIFLAVLVGNYLTVKVLNEDKRYLLIRDIAIFVSTFLGTKLQKF